jgi:hypothetical protein
VVIEACYLWDRSLFYVRGQRASLPRWRNGWVHAPEGVELKEARLIRRVLGQLEGERRKKWHSRRR